MTKSLVSLIRMLDRMREPEFDFREWDDFVSIKQKQSDLEPWRKRCAEIEVRYSGLSNGRFLTDEGWLALEKLENELQIAHNCENKTKL
jgi:hypothetical protein